MLEWNPRLVYLVLALVAIAALLARVHAQPLNYGW
jgi:hypothetical protein